MIRLIPFESELVKALSKGEIKAFNDLFQIYGNRIFRFALGYLKSEQDAEELVQDVFMRIHHKQPMTDVPQVLTVYKEVLKLYNEGLEVQDDMTVVWTDDNYGYIQQLNSWKEKGRKGGTGVYYHLDYLGRLQSYVWLSTVHPMLIWKELNRAYNAGANRLWVFN